MQFNFKRCFKIREILFLSLFLKKKWVIIIFIEMLYTCLVVYIKYLLFYKSIFFCILYFPWYLYYLRRYSINVIFLKIIIYLVWNFKQTVSISITLHRLFIDSRAMRLIECIRTRIDLFRTFQNVPFKEVILRRCEQGTKLGQFIYIVNITFATLYISVISSHALRAVVNFVSVS